MAAQPDIELALITPDCYGKSRLSHPAFAAARPAFQTFPIAIRFARRQGAFLYDEPSLERALDAFQPDVLLHEQEVYTLGAGQIAAVASRRSLPVVMFVWENVDRKLALPRRLLSRYVMKRCAGLLAGSVAAARVHKDWGFCGPIEVVPQMGVPSVVSAPAWGRRDPDCFQITFAGRLIASKGVDCLLRAVAALPLRDTPVRCTVAGDGPERAALEELTRSLGIAERVSFSGAIPFQEIASLLQRSDVLVLPSRRSRVWEEQFGRILIEAMAQGTVTVGSRTGAIPEVIGADELLFEENDHAGLAVLLAGLEADPARFRRLQSFLWQRASDCYLNDVLAYQRVKFLARLRTRDRVAHSAKASQDA